MMQGRYCLLPPFRLFLRGVRIRSQEAWVQTVTSQRSTVWQHEKHVSMTVSALKMVLRYVATPLLDVDGESFQIWWKTTRSIDIWSSIVTGGWREFMAASVVVSTIVSTDMFRVKTKFVGPAITNFPLYLRWYVMTASATNASRVLQTIKDKCSRISFPELKAAASPSRS